MCRNDFFFEFPDFGQEIYNNKFEVDLLIDITKGRALRQNARVSNQFDRLRRNLSSGC